MCQNHETKILVNFQRHYHCKFDACRRKKKHSSKVRLRSPSEAETSRRTYYYSNITSGRIRGSWNMQVTENTQSWEGVTDNIFCSWTSSVWTGAQSWQFGRIFLALRSIPSRADILLAIESMCLFHDRFESSVTHRYLNLHTRYEIEVNSGRIFTVMRSMEVNILEASIHQNWRE